MFINGTIMYGGQSRDIFLKGGDTFDITSE